MTEEEDWDGYIGNNLFECGPTLLSRRPQHPDLSQSSHDKGLSYKTCIVISEKIQVRL